MKATRDLLIAWGKNYLAEKGVPEPRVDAELLFLKASGLSREELLVRPDGEVEPAAEARFRELIRRRGEREPFFYLAGEREFWSLPIQVAPGVLIPRPETELLVEETIKIARSREQGAGSINPDSESGARKSGSSPLAPRPLLPAFDFLDLGTGSGAIALAILSEIPEACAWATDLSPESLQVAAGNARRLRLEERIQFLAGDLFEPIRRFREFFHLMTCNPPYIPSAIIPTLSPEVAKGEPLLALDGGEDGLRVIRRVVDEAFDYLRAPGFLLMEIGDTQAEAVRGLLERTGRYQDIRVIKDYSGRDRVIKARRNDD